MKIALIADDNKKTLMEDLCIAYRPILSKHELFATGSTGRLIEACTGLHVYKYLTGHLGGGEQLSAQVAQNQMDLVIFLRDAHSRVAETTLLSLLRQCDIQNIPAATNIATAEALLLALERGDLDWRELI